MNKTKDNSELKFSKRQAISKLQGKKIDKRYI